ncbi:MAG: nucleotidyl transferase AbiEii/AbiGii toxin family protein [Arhodomonas sp.]|nr:nucleotidyl transferase AbiEii/AbiGii toxin family protein [Arhodomonas sp.]
MLPHQAGTAINLFIRNLPRLSVDIDLTYLPIADRQSSLAAIDAALRRIAAQVQNANPRITVTESAPRSTGSIRAISSTYITCCATKGLRRSLRAALIVYLISHDHPPHALLSNACRDVAQLRLPHNFQGMADEDVASEVLTETHRELVRDIVGNMPDHHRRFLFSFYRRAPAPARYSASKASTGFRRSGGGSSISTKPERTRRRTSFESSSRSSALRTRKDAQQTPVSCSDDLRRVAHAADFLWATPPP